MEKLIQFEEKSKVLLNGNDIAFQLQMWQNLLPTDHPHLNGKTNHGRLSLL